MHAIKRAKETSIVTYSCRKLSKADVEERNGDRLTSGESRIGSKAGVAGISRDGEEVRWLGEGQ